MINICINVNDKHRYKQAITKVVGLWRSLTRGSTTGSRWAWTESHVLEYSEYSLSLPIAQSSCSNEQEFQIVRFLKCSTFFKHLIFIWTQWENLRMSNIRCSWRLHFWNICHQLSLTSYHPINFHLLKFVKCHYCVSSPGNASWPLHPWQTREVFEQLFWYHYP